MPERHDEPIRWSGWETTWLFADLQGTVRSYGRSFGDINSISWTIIHRGFGNDGEFLGRYSEANQNYETESFGIPVIWQGQTFDTFSDLYIAQGRVYDPQMRRFLSQSGDSGTNPYVYGNNAPSNVSFQPVERLSEEFWAGIEGPGPYSSWLHEGTGELFRSTLGDEYLSQASLAELYTVTTVGYFAGIAAGAYAVGAAGLTGAWAALVGGAVGGAAEYGATWGTAAAFDYLDGDGSYSVNNPTLAGFAEYTIGGAVGGAVGHIAGAGLGKTFRLGGAAAQELGAFVRRHPGLNPLNYRIRGIVSLPALPFEYVPPGWIVRRSGLAVPARYRGIPAPNNVRERVLASISASRAARESSNFHVHAAYERLAQLRRGLGMSNTGVRRVDGVLGELSLNGQRHYGINSWTYSDNAARQAFIDAGFANPVSGRPPLSIVAHHAEGDAVLQAYRAGNIGGHGVWFVDADLCGFCGRRGGLRGLGRGLGLSRLEVYERLPNGTIRWTPNILD